MTEKTIIHIVGNRPQFVKLAVLYRAIKEGSSFKQLIIHTGQHFSENMNDIFFEELTIPNPDFHFSNTKSAEMFIAKSIESIRGVLDQQPGDALVFTYGDTNSTLAGAIAAAKSERKLIHFESGVRTENKSMPEEMNRVLTDRLSDIHFCCTQKNVDNLIAEGYGTEITSQVFLTGDLMLDAFKKIAPSSSSIVHSGEYIVSTIHRAENITDKHHLTEITKALNRIHNDCEVIVPLHPHTAKMLRQFGLNLNCNVVDPLGYREMKELLLHCQSVVTDSGGTVREAFFSKKKSVVIMKSPFWSEIIDAQAGNRADAKEESIVRSFHDLDTLQPNFELPIFGDGSAAEKITSHLNALTL